MPSNYRSAHTAIVFQLGLFSHLNSYRDLVNPSQIQKSVRLANESFWKKQLASANVPDFNSIQFDGVGKSEYMCGIIVSNGGVVYVYTGGFGEPRRFNPQEYIQL